ncbi:P-loop containing nucleoside triphosphate hydrolase protein [Pisolithus tinctorius]|uniref:RNA helicase n=1 Tax=Pisolithus tinctorius Marx 270 TaxID=870435 RepID=A0A0C3NGM3_PISTI|nr:P-loop containing nucleoside triphosphate hydrolase protein [Pisolithus tinctorius]KIN94845.1 hypothetical protein M404DRAFT_34684 [Pisolithus tinctorius Marx 270]
MLLADIAAARGYPVPVTPAHMLAPQDTQQKAEITAQPISYPFNFLLTSATIPNSLSNYLATYHPTLTRLASPHLHHLPLTLRTEHASWTGGNKDVDIERRIRRVWAEDALVHAKTTLGGPRPVKLSKVIVFCNKRRKVEELGAFLDGRGIKCVALTGNADGRQRGSNHHLDGFLKQSSPTSSTDVAVPPLSSDPAVTPHVLVTTSLLSRGLDFHPDIKHVFIVDEPRNMIDFLHRAGRAGRAGEVGKVVVFGRSKGRGSGRAVENFSHVGHREVRPPPTQVNDMPEESKWRLPERASRLCFQGAMLRSYESIALDLQILFTNQIVGIDAKKATKTNICVVVPGTPTRTPKKLFALVTPALAAEARRRHQRRIVAFFRITALEHPT